MALKKDKNRERNKMQSRTFLFFILFAIKVSVKLLFTKNA